jgi:phosphatidate phosphatase PAH1
MRKIHIEVNGEICSNITMTAHKTGEIYFSPSAIRKNPGSEQAIFSLRELDEEG